VIDTAQASNGVQANGGGGDGETSMNGSASPLGAARVGFRGCVHAIEVTDESSGLPTTELETRLLELGFLEGAPVEILHEGAFGGDPIAVRIDNITIALRRREAMAILVEARS
jgi:ferrous iron transport protein A